ncbi:MAG: alpha-L-arabinofuranosidase, partial [Bacteroidales bacterium]|nr:alpha-L-arabinofuranosidase [Bacteroidales bacterium]
MRKFSLSLYLLFITALFLSTKAQVTIQADFSQLPVPISPTHMGAFFEDINYAADGGLYAELIQNRSFEYYPVSGYTDLQP